MATSRDPRYQTNQLLHHDVCATYEVIAPPAHQNMDSEHDGLEILFTPAQVGFTTQDMVLRGRKFNVNAGQALIYNGLEKHTEVYQRDHGSRVLALVVPTGFTNELLGDAGIDSREILFSGVELAMNEERLEKLMSVFSYRNTPGVSDVAFDALVSEIVLDVLLSSPHSFSHKLKRSEMQGYFPRNVDRAKRAIAQRLGEQELSLDDMANAAGLSRFHFLRSFKECVGLSPAKYLQALRIDHAKAQLHRGIPVADVARASGFGCISTFNKAFRRQTRLSPSDYRSLSKIC